MTDKMTGAKFVAMNAANAYGALLLECAAQIDANLVKDAIIAELTSRLANGMKRPDDPTAFSQANTE